MKIFYYQLIVCIFLFSMVLNAQIGIGTPTPHKETNLHLADKNKALLLNHVYEKTAFTDPKSGMLFYDKEDECFRGYANGEFTDCFGAKPSDPVVRVDGPGFKGTFVRGEQLTNATFEITVTNNTFKEVELGFHISDLKITGNGVMVASVYQAGSTDVSNPDLTLKFAAGAAKTVVYKLSGIPEEPYTQILGEWNKIVLTYDDVQDVSYNINCALGVWTKGLPSSDNGLLKNGITYDLEYVIPINNSTGFDFNAVEVSVAGLTLKREITTGSTNAQLVYTIKGTYTGADAVPVNFGVVDGCVINAGRYPFSCLEILNLFPNSTSGQYKIDVDGPGIEDGVADLPPMDCYCDMETRSLADGTSVKGGWTLIMNYNHKAGTNPELIYRKKSLPILGSVTLGVDESIGVDGLTSSTRGATFATPEDWAMVNNKYWGHASFLSKMQFSTIRFYGETSNHLRLIHFMTDAKTVIDNVKINNTLPGIESTSSKNFALPTGKLKAELPHVAKSNYDFTIFLFARDGYEHWSIRATNSSGVNARWNVDDDSYNTATTTNSASTIHQIWVK